MKRIGYKTRRVLVKVAPLAGAWIETAAFPLLENKPCESRPSRARGLKHLTKRAGRGKVNVAPLAGAWIETFLSVFAN